MYITGALPDPKSRKNINAGDFYFGFEHPCSQMFAVEPSFIRIDIRGRTNLPQNRKTIHNEDIDDTSRFWQQYIVAVLVVRYTTVD
jgi:hypothetical protein